MKYGISNFPEETPFEKKDTSDEIRMASDDGTATAAPTMANTRQQSEMDADAVIFSIQFYGKTIGEVGMMDQDLSELDWKKFKSYLFQNLLSVNQQENICVSYSDEEGDKLPIDSDEEYREALKVAKKKAEMHDKLVLDITRQGGFPAVLSLVSSGIKKVSSSPPKEGGISFFKASSPPKDSAGFKAGSSERKLFQGFFLPDRGPIPGHVQGVWGYDCDEALECGKVNTTSATTTTTTTTTSPVPSARRGGPPVRALRNSPPNLLFNFEVPNHNVSPTSETSACQDIFGAGVERGTGARPKDSRTRGDFLQQPPEWFTSYMSTFRAQITEEVSARVVSQVENLLKRNNTLLSSELQESHVGRKYARHSDGEKSEKEDKPQRACIAAKKSLDEVRCDDSDGRKDGETPAISFSTLNAETPKTKKKEEKNLGAKRKKLAKEEERLLKKQEKEEKLLKKQEKLEKKRFILQSKYADEMDKANRTQEKVFAKMEGLRKKQFCSQEELSKLRKMVDKQQRFITTEQRQQRRNERKAGYQKCGRAKKINIDNKAFPVDASLLHAALQELEALAEDSTSDGAASAMTRGYDALYLKDITYPDGSVVYPGKEFVKTWRVVNNGVMPWNEETTLCKWSQVRFRGSPSGWKLKPSMKRVVCPPLEPGQEGDISITFTAPSEPGWYATHWRFCQRGRVFGNQMWCAIRVEAEPVTSHLDNIQLEKPAGEENANRPSAKEALVDLLLHQGVRETIEKPSWVELEPQSGSAPYHEELVPPSDLGIVENYYDAEDPVQRECTEGLQKLSLSCSGETEKPAEEKKERDLILFEEEAEVVDSGLSTPEMLPSTSQSHSVVPLKEMAKESVENLILKDQELKSQQQEGHQLDANQSDSISMSSGSFSELDSEDQAILNESDSDGSDHEYYVVHLPDCFNTNTVNEDKEVKSNPKGNPVGWQEEMERPDSPDFLTADEDDRTTAVASDSSEDLTCPVHEQESASRSLDDSQASDPPSQDDGKSEPQLQKSSSGASSLPDPPTDTKPFMAIPNEAFQTNLFYAPPQSNAGDQSSQSQAKQEAGTWATRSPSVVCQQPYSSQHKEAKPDILNCDGIPSSVSSQSSSITTTTTTAAATTTTTNNNNNNAPSQLPVDLVGALPDELVSIIPEDLVRGAWNTARSFITRINQEMLSPTSDSPGRVYIREEADSANESQQPLHSTSAPSSESQCEEEHQENTSANTVVSQQRETPSPLAPPLQQLEDMGFHNREVNERLLTKYNGDVSCAVAELIVLNCH